MNHAESKFAKRFQMKALKRLLVDFLETSRSGLSDSLVTNRNGVGMYVEFKSVDARVRDNSCPLKGKFESGQIAFLRERRTWGMPCFVLAEIGGIPYLLNPAFDLGEMTMWDLRQSSAMAGGPVLQTGLEEIVEYLCMVTRV